MLLIRKYLNSNSGATAIEYGLIAGIVSIAMIVSGPLIGAALDDIFTWIADKLATAV